MRANSPTASRPCKCHDLKELRVQKRYLQEQGTAIDCTCFCSGEKLLAQLRQGVRYDAVVLCSELTICLRSNLSGSFIS